MGKLITARDIEQAASGGQREIAFEQGAVITPAARDRARELGVTIRNGNGASLNGGYRAPALAAPPRAALGPGARPAGGQFVPVQAAPAPAAPAAPRSAETSPTYFENVVLDNLMNITLELGAALWVVKERLRVVEELLNQKGVVTTEQIETYRPDPARERELRAARDAFIEKIYKSIKENPG